MKTRKTPQRSCLGCGLKTDKGRLIRVVRTPEGLLVLDKTGKIPGRGAYICPRQECLKSATKKRALDRALNTKMDESILERLQEAMPKEQDLPEE